MQQNTRPIGIIDSGIGGFSVTKKVQQILPNENLVYLGDGANTPYGNYSQQDILTLTRHMIQFMADKQVKALLIACNTISCLIEEYENDIDCPVLSVVQAGAQAACLQSGKKIGVISTCFTASTGCYPTSIAQLDASRTVISHGCPNLAGLVERNVGDLTALPLIDDDLRNELTPLVTEENIDCCVLGCTHYPLVEDRIALLFPSLPLIDPAEQMARTVGDYLATHNLANDSGQLGRLDIYTTSTAAEYTDKANKVGLTPISSVGVHQPISIPR